MEFSTPQPGDTIAGRFELISKIGAGAFGAVFKARQLGIDRQVAVKLLMPEADTVDSTAVARFKREAKLSSSLEHPNTITIHDYGEWQGILYLAMEYVRGQSLRAAIKKEGRMAPERGVRITQQILASLAEAHSRGIIHRDMKPANIMLFDRFSEKDVVKVLDFGIAKFVSNDGAGMGPQAVQEDLTVAGRIVGTPRYMAPEQVKGLGASPSSDLYGLGLILYEMVAGRKAVTGDSTMSLIAMQLSPQPAIKSDDPLIPPGLMPVILKATHKDPTQRYQSSKEFSEALATADLVMPAGIPGLAPPPLPPALGGSSSIIVAPQPEEISLDDELDALLISDAGSRKGLYIGAAVAIAFILLVGVIAVPMVIISNNNAEKAQAEKIAAEEAEKKKKEDARKAAEADALAKKAEEDRLKKIEADKKAAAEAKEAAKLTLKITTTPDGAAIMKGDEVLGVAPVTLKLDPAEAKALKVIKDGFEEGEIDINAGMNPEVSVSLKKIRSKNTNRTGPGKNPGKGTGKGNVYKPL